MGFLFCRKVLFFLFLLAGFVFSLLQPQTASGLATIDVALKWVAFKSPAIHTHKADDSEKKLNMKNMNVAPSPAMNFDPNQSNKRRVKKGSDPIHNRC
ncbi:hypothetical protein SDJN03_14929, partial [Cucurbita argyrosperma subsp. sororia]